jgi:hypothetical protein
MPETEQVDHFAEEKGALDWNSDDPVPVPEPWTD